MVLFEEGRVKVTNRRVVAADGHSYPLLEIVSADTERHIPWDGWLISGIATGTLIALTGGWMLASASAARIFGVGLGIVGLGATVFSYWVRESVKKNRAIHIATVDTESQQNRIICAAREAVGPELVVRAIRVAMQVGDDAVSFRAVFYHPQLPGEAVRAEPDAEDAVGSGYDPFD